MRVILAGGGTAGHISPALAVADALRRADPSIGLTFLGTERGLETRLVPQHGYELATIPPVPLPRSVTPQLLTVPGRLAAAVSASARVLDRTRADAVVGFGGYVSTPAYLAARRRRVPIVVHEANPRPGLANRLGARLTRHVFTGHPGTSLPHARYIGIPLRRQITEVDRLDLADKARAHFGFRPDLPVLLVTGGSQGARSLNQATLAAAGWIRAGRRAAAAHRRAALHRGRAAVRAGPGAADRAVHGPDGSRLRRCRPGAVPGRGEYLRRGHRGRPAGRVRPAPARQRRADAERGAHRPRPAAA